MFGFIPFIGSLKEKRMFCPLRPILNAVPRWRPSWKMDQLQSNNTWSAPHQKHSCHVWFHSIHLFFKKKKFVCFVHRVPMDGRQEMSKAHLALRTSDIKMGMCGSPGYICEVTIFYY